MTIRGEQIGVTARWILCALLLVTGVFNVGAIYAVGTIGESFTLPVLAAAAALAIPTLIGIVWLIGSATRRAVGYAAGLGIVGTMGAISLGSMAFLGAWNPGDAEGVMQLIGFLVAPNLALALAAVVVSLKSFGRTGLAGIAIGVALALALDAAAGVAAMVGMTAVGMGATFQWGGQLTEIERVLNRVTACAFQFAEQSPDGSYPPSLAAIGPGGNGCLDESHEAKVREMQIVYEPEGSAPVRSFRITGFAKAIDGDHIRGGADTSGIVMTHTGDSEVRIGSSGTELAAMRMAALRNCALLARNLGRNERLPRSTTELADLGRESGDAMRMGCDRSFDSDVPDAEGFVHEGRRYSYRVDEAAQTFEIQVRPVEYGVTGINSYLLRSVGEVHVTHSNRAATDDDATIPACTYPDSTWNNTVPKRCVRLARPRIEVPVGTLRPESVAATEEFVISIDTTAPLPAGMTFQLMCAATAEQMKYEGLMNLHPRPGRRCSTWQWKEAFYLVRLFARDSLGAIGWRLDSIAVQPPHQ